MEDFTELTVWQKSHRVVLDIYKITKDFPREERYGLSSQMRRAAVSVAANIAEGFKQKSTKSKLNMYNISLASSQEVKYYLILCRDLKYYTDIQEITSRCNEVGKMLNGLMGSIKNKNP